MKNLTMYLSATIVILENYSKLIKSKAAVWVRTPVISYVNGSTEVLKNFLNEKGYPEKTSFFPITQWKNTNMMHSLNLLQNLLRRVKKLKTLFESL